MSTCGTETGYAGGMPVRISAVFVILVASMLGAWLPVIFSRRKRVNLPSWVPFIARYLGSGVIVATAFIHLLAPANEALSNPCLRGVITEYPWVEGICLIAVFTLFFVELMMMRFGKFGVGHGHGAHTEPASHSHGIAKPALVADSGVELQHNVSESPSPSPVEEPNVEDLDVRSERDDIEHLANPLAEPYAAQLTGVFILEFGVVFHSVFIGLTLASAGVEFNILYVVLTFHQTFEGIALGTRLGGVQWPKARWWTPDALALGYAFSTPTALAIGLGVRQTLQTSSQSTLVANGVFDSISAGILIYTGLVELMAHDFLFSTHMQCAPVKKMLGAFASMVLGAFIMAVLARWA